MKLRMLHCAMGIAMSVMMLSTVKGQTVPDNQFTRPVLVTMHFDSLGQLTIDNVVELRDNDMQAIAQAYNESQPWSFVHSSDVILHSAIEATRHFGIIVYLGYKKIAPWLITWIDKELPEIKILSQRWYQRLCQKFNAWWSGSPAVASAIAQKDGASKKHPSKVRHVRQVDAEQQVS